MSSMITNHVELAKKRLLEQNKNKPLLDGLLTAIIQEHQNLETMFFDLLEDRSINTAVGFLLDRLGTIVGQTREPGQSDDDYRLAIKTRVSINVSQGEPERAISVYQALLGATLVMIQELYPAAVALMSEIVPSNLPAVFRTVRQVIPAGVRLDFLGTFDLTEPFAMDGVMVGSGFGTTADPLVGGKFATVYIDNTVKFAFNGTGPNNGGFGSIHDNLVGGVFI